MTGSSAFGSGTAMPWYPLTIATSAAMIATNARRSHWFGKTLRLIEAMSVVLGIDLVRAARLNRDFLRRNGSAFANHFAQGKARENRVRTAPFPKRSAGKRPAITLS